MTVRRGTKLPWVCEKAPAVVQTFPANTIFLLVREQGEEPVTGRARILRVYTSCYLQEWPASTRPRYESRVRVTAQLECLVTFSFSDTRLIWTHGQI